LSISWQGFYDKVAFAVEKSTPLENLQQIEKFFENFK